MGCIILWLTLSAAVLMQTLRVLSRAVALDMECLSAPDKF